MPVRILLADHSELALIGLRSVFAAVPRVEIVGEARDPIELQALLVREKPDVVLIDHTAKGFGPDVIRDGVKRAKRTRFVAITPDPSRLALVSALRGGVTSYIKKDCDVQEIIDAVLETADGKKFFCGQIIEAIERASINVKKIVDEPLSCAPLVITEREAEIIGLIAEGCSYTRIASRLNLSAHTITSHRKKIMQKLGVNSTAALVLYAVKNGLVSPNKFLFNI
jgi:DNA-binding NarL/FixJ family response regulator